MKDWTSVKQRYLRDAVPVRLGGLAANLSRIQSFSTDEASREVVAGLIEESKFFIEWTAREAQIDTAAQLVELQVQLARWQRSWPEIWLDAVRREQLVKQSGDWSSRVMELSGLLK